jgi:hypothetical protein
MYNDDGWWIAPAVFAFFAYAACFAGAYTIGFNIGEDTGRGASIIYCMEQPAKCKVEYQYLKLTEKTK